MEVAIFDAGGFMFSSSSPSMAPAPGQAAPGVSQVFGSSGFGLWQARPDGTVAFKFLEIMYDQNGDYMGYVNIHGNLSLDLSVATFSGSYTVTVTSVDGNSFDIQGPTPVIGTREGL
jgi:hypothetical protein